LPALAYFSKIFTFHDFLSNLPSKKGRSNVTYPVRVRVKGTIGSMYHTLALIRAAGGIYDFQNFEDI
jgi:hypothetical protein